MGNKNIKNGIGRNSAAHYEWRRAIKERDGECRNCGTKEKLHAHHIIPWKVNESKRFDIENGITLCASCHKKEDGCVPAGWNKGLKRSEEWCKKLSESCKGRKVWNKGVKGLIISPETQFKKGQIPWNKGKSSLKDERRCKNCGETKNICMFTPLQKGKFYSHVCKTCRNLKIKRTQNANHNQSIGSNDYFIQRADGCSFKPSKQCGSSSIRDSTYFKWSSSTAFFPGYRKCAHSKCCSFYGR